LGESITKHRVTLVCVLALLSLVPSCAEQQFQVGPPLDAATLASARVAAAETARRLEAKLPATWTVTTQDNAVIIYRKKPVRHYSLSHGQYPNNDFWVVGDLYPVIALHLNRLMSSDEYRKAQSRNRKALDKVPAWAREDDAIIEYTHEHPNCGYSMLPAFQTSEHSVYVKPFSFDARQLTNMADEADRAECQDVLDIIDATFEKYAGE
jgi:hypothetical protein